MKKYSNIRSTKMGMILSGGCKGGHARIKCPCMECMIWRRQQFSPKKYREIQEEIRRVIYEKRQEDLKLSKEIDKVLKENK